MASIDATSAGLASGLGAAWDGSVLEVAGGDYDEALTITKRIEFRGAGGTVVVGK